MSSVVGITVVPFLFATALGAATPKLIIDTDLRSDVDDAGALALANALMDNGECELIGVVASQTGPAIVSAINAINTFYGRGDIPVGISPIDDQRFDDFYAPVIGDPAHYPSTQRNATVPESTRLYRRLLNESPDGSVVIVVIGSQTCVNLLLASEADFEGDGSIGRTGRDLVASKVRELVLMAGNFVDAQHPEHNIALDPAASQQIAATWPTPVVYSGFEIGRAILTGGRMRDPETNPVAKAYELFPAGGIGNIAPSASYDQTAVYYAVRGVNAGEEPLWDLSEPGRVTFPESLTRFAPAADGPHRYLIPKAPVERVAEVIEQLMTQPPKARMTPDPAGQK